MTRNLTERRTPEQIRAGNKRIGLIMFAVAAVFFASVIIDQYVRFLTRVVQVCVQAC